MVPRARRYLIQEPRPGSVVKLPARTNGRVSQVRPLRDKSRYYIAFIGRENLEHWHAFVQWFEVDAHHKMAHAEAFGFYPAVSEWTAVGQALWGGPVPGVLQNEYLKDGVSGNVVLRVEVTLGEYHATKRVRDDWRQRAAADKIRYDLLGSSCIDFADRIARVLGRSHPPLKIPAYDYSRPPAWEVVLIPPALQIIDALNDKNLTRTPLSYISELYNLNKEHHVQIKDLGLIR